MGHLKKSHFSPALGPGKSAGDITEELRFQQGTRYGRAVQLDIGAMAAITQAVKHVGRYILSDARLTAEQYGSVGFSHPGNHIHGVLHSLAFNNHLRLVHTGLRMGLRAFLRLESLLSIQRVDLAEHLHIPNVGYHTPDLSVGIEDGNPRSQYLLFRAFSVGDLQLNGLCLTCLQHEFRHGLGVFPFRHQVICPPPQYIIPGESGEFLPGGVDH